jgi:hypothetical protein
MAIAAYVISALILVTAALYFGVTSRDARKFLAGAFFVNGGVAAYLSLAKVSVPLLGTSFVLTPEFNAWRAVVSLALFALTFYFGFLWRRP